MSDVTRILSCCDLSDPKTADELLPLVYDELRAIAARKLTHEKPGHTLQCTALVHEAYLRLLDASQVEWKNCRHFFGAAAEAMRRILIESARRRQSAKGGGGHHRQPLSDFQLAVPSADLDELMDLNEALDRLARTDPLSAELVKLRYFAGLTVKQSAEVLGVSARKTDFLWAYARAWLRNEMHGE